jgi:hypothetical protein
MNETAHSGGTGPSHRGVEIGVAVAMALFGVIVIAGSLQVGIGWGAEGPRSGFFPFYIGLLIVAASLANLFQALALQRGGVFADWDQLWQVLLVVIPSVIYVFAIPWIGIYVSSVLLISAFMVKIGRYSPLFSTGLALAIMVATYFIFEKWFLVPLPKGPLEDILGL